MNKEKKEELLKAIEDYKEHLTVNVEDFTKLVIKFYNFVVNENRYAAYDDYYISLSYFEIAYTGKISYEQMVSNLLPFLVLNNFAKVYETHYLGYDGVGSQDFIICPTSDFTTYCSWEDLSEKGTIETIVDNYIDGLIDAEEISSRRGISSLFKINDAKKDLKRLKY